MNSSTPSQFREDFVVLKHNVDGGSSILLQVETCLWQGPKFWVQPSVIFEAVQHRSRKWLQWLTKFFYQLILILLTCTHLFQTLNTWSQSYLMVVYDQNQVSVSGTETKVQFRYRYQSRFFFHYRNFFSSKFFKYSHVFLVCMGI